MKKIILTTASVALLAAAPVHATVYNISFDYLQGSLYTASKPMVGGAPDPFHLIGPAGVPVLAMHVGPWGNIGPQVISGSGWLDTITGQIHLNPTDIEITVVSGSYGYVGWSQTINGSFNGTDFIMSGATVNGGSIVCEDATSNGCVSSGGVGSAPAALGLAQTYTPLVLDEDGWVVTPEVPVQLIPIGFDFIGTGGHGQYLHQSNILPAFEITSIDFVIGSEVSQVPVPAAAWLFGSGLLGLVGAARKRR